MTLLRTMDMQCPYCGEMIDVVVDCSVDEQAYIEDCSVCCRPITLVVNVDDDGEPVICARHENE
ncbi:MAG: CPXCG motif-containing cysteine-rich protein [Porticoccaceae bacterium]